MALLYTKDDANIVIFSQLIKTNLRDKRFPKNTLF